MCCCYFLKISLFFKEVLGSQQNWSESIESSHIPHPPTLSLIHYWHLAQGWHTCYHQWTYIHKSLSTIVYSLNWSLLWVVYILWVLTNVEWHVLIPIISYRIVSCPKSPLCSIHHSLPSNPWQPLVFFTVSIVLSFLKYHIVGIIHLFYLFRLALSIW